MTVSWILLLRNRNIRFIFGLWLDQVWLATLEASSRYLGDIEARERAVEARAKHVIGLEHLDIGMVLYTHWNWDPLHYARTNGPVGRDPSFDCRAPSSASRAIKGTSSIRGKGRSKLVPLLGILA